MKKQILAVSVVAAFAMGGTAHAENTGCGLGSQVWDGQEGIAPQVLAVTTNGTSGNQTFGITTGTLGCESDGVVRADARVAMYASANMEAIARDMATGEGEALDTLAELMGIEEGDRASFGELTRANFQHIFADSETTTEQMLANIDVVLAEDEQLSRYVA